MSPELSARRAMFMWAVVKIVTNSGRLSLLNANSESCFDTTISGAVTDKVFKLGLEGAQL